MTRKEILNTAEKYVCEDRNESYSEPEDSFSNISNFWNDHLFGKYGFEGIMPEDVGIMMALLKIARMASRTKDDNFIDAAGYIACAGEIASRWPSESKEETLAQKAGLRNFNESPMIIKGVNGKGENVELHIGMTETDAEELAKFWEGK